MQQSREKEASKQINIVQVRKKKEIKLHYGDIMNCLIRAEKYKESSELTLVVPGCKITTTIIHHIHRQQMSRKVKYVVTVSKPSGGT